MPCTQCADALVTTERAIATRIAARLDVDLRERPTALLSEIVGSRAPTRFVWLRGFETGATLNAVNDLLDRLDRLRTVGISQDVLKGIPAHRIARLRRRMAGRHRGHGDREP